MRTYGSKIQPGNPYRPAAEIARDMRADIKAAVKAGELPGKPTKYSVRVHNYAGGRAIDITIQGWPGTVYSDEKHVPWGSVYKMTPEAEAVIDAVKAIHDAYNYDGSDVMTDYFDVNFYGQVSFESEWARERRVS